MSVQSSTATRPSTTAAETNMPHGRPDHELVPSRYALKVGEIDAMVVSDGIIGVARDGVIGLPTKMLAHNADPAAREAWMEDRFLPSDTFGWALNAVVVRSGGRTILIDAGFGEEYPGAPQVGRWAKRLEAAGIDPAAVTDVVLTHLHMDHVGGLLADGVKERLRKDLQIHVAAAEAEFWEAPVSPASICRRDSRRRWRGGQAVLASVPRPVADVRERVRGGAGGARPTHRRPHPRA